MMRNKRILKNIFLEKDQKERLHMMQYILQNIIINKYMIHHSLQ